MAVINLSPDSQQSFSIAGSPQEALDRAKRFREYGATIIDLGGQSSHYDNPTIDADVELERLLPAVELLVDDGFVVSVDTWKPSVASACLAEGVTIVNDTGGMQDPAMRRTVAAAGATAIVMYIEGDNPHSVGEIDVRSGKAELTAEWLRRRLSELESEGIGNTIVDPGIAINYHGDYGAYTSTQLEVIRSVDTIRSVERPVLIPIPRKREDHRVAAYITMAVEYGADVIRAHDVEMACDLVALFGRTP
jgi:dihydropteroate synthase